MEFAPSSSASPKSPANDVHHFSSLALDQASRKLLGEIIAYRRESLGYTQKYVAKQVNCSITTICFLETARCKDYKMYFLRSVAEVLRIDVFLLLYILLHSLDREKIQKIYLALDSTSPNSQGDHSTATLKLDP